MFEAITHDHRRWQRRTIATKRARRKTLLLETLEARVVLSTVPGLVDLNTAANSDPSDIVTVGESALVSDDGSQRELWLLSAEAEAEDLAVQLTIFVNGEEITLPANIGVDEDGNFARAYTLDASGQILLDPAGDVTLADFFEVWRTDAGLAGNNEDALLSSTQLLSHVADTTSTLQMFVNGQVSHEFDECVLQDGDAILLVYGSDPVVSLNTTFGSIIVELYADETPLTVANFLNYVNDGDYINSIFHRSDPGFVIQGGGYTTLSTTFGSTAQFASVPTDDPVLNEPGISNVRGTIAMAKTSDPDSATSQFFINLSDSNTFLDSETNGAFTVFGQVLGMATVDTIEDLTVSTANASPFAELPLGTDNQLAVIESIAGQGALRGNKFLDENANGLRDEGEEAIAGGVVFVDANQNGLQDDGERSTVTDSDGAFLMQIEPGTYVVRSMGSAGMVGTLPADGGGYTVTVEIGGETSDLAFGEAVSEDASTGNSISGYVYIDLDGDGHYDANESGVPGAQITLTGTELSEASVSRTLLTNSSGYYLFSDLPAGTYQIQQRQPTAMTDAADESSFEGAVVANDSISSVVLNGGVAVDGNNFGERGLKAEYISITWFFASARSSDELIRDAVAWAEDRSGNTTLAEAIRNGSMDSENPPDAAPVAAADSYAVVENGTLTVAAADGVLQNDTDADGDSVTAILVTSPAHGTLSLDADGSFTYTPDDDYHGTDSFTYQASDAQTLSNVATVQITVSQENSGPVAVADSYAVDEDGTLTITSASGVLANDSDVDEQTLSVTLVTDTVHGQLELSSDGSFTYVPAADYSGTDTFSYVANDGITDSATATVTISVNAVNDVVEVSDDTYSVIVSTTLEVATANGVLANDVDVEGDTLSAELVTDVTHGTLVLAADGSFTYTPETDFVGTDSFTYRVDDGLAVSETASVVITVRAVNHPPLTAADSYTVEEDGILEVDATSGVLSNDSDSDGDDLSVALVTGVNHGELVLNADGSFTYTPESHYFGTDTFVYFVTDGEDDSEEASVTLTISPVDDPVETVGDTYVTYVDSPLVVSAADGVLSNDGDVDDDELTTVLGTSTSHGTLVLNTDGSFTYTPDSGYTGSDSFTYTVQDGVSSYGPVTATISVSAANLVEYRLEATLADGTPVSSVSQGDEFLLTVYVADLRADASGVFAAYLDILFDPDLVELNGDILYGDDFPNGHIAGLSTSGLIDELGAFASFTELGAGEYVLATIPLRAIGTGTADFDADLADEAVNATLLFDYGDDVPSGQIVLTDASLQILAAGEGESASSYLAAVDEFFTQLGS